MASTMSTFTTFMNITGPSFLTGPQDIVNEAVKQTYILGRFLRGSDMSRVLQGGSDIRDSVMFDEQSSASFYAPNATFTETNPQVITNWKAYWRFYKDSMVWTDQELELQIPEGVGTPTRHQIYKRIKYQKEQRLWTSMLNGMEDNLWAVPVAADMEAETGLDAYSIPAFLNEFQNSLFYSGWTPTGATAWTVKQTVNPAIENRWRMGGYDENANGFRGTQVTSTNTLYNSASLTASGGNRNILQAFDQAWMYTKFIPPPTKQEYFENAALNKQFIACSFRGQGIYVDMLRTSQDAFVTSSRQDPAYVNPSYAGVDVVRIHALNDALLYGAETATDALVSELPGAGVGEASGPRYYFINGNYICPTFHAKRYMVKHPAMRHRDQPFTTVQYVDTWYNLNCRSMQRHTIVAPSADDEPYTV